MSTGGTDPVPPQPGVILFALVSLVASAVLAEIVARRDREHRPAATALELTAAASCARYLLARVAPSQELDEALYLVSTVVVPWAAARLFLPALRHVTDLALFVWLGLSIFAIMPPVLRGDELYCFYLVSELSALAACMAIGIQARGLVATPARAVVALLTGLSALGLVVGPWSRGLFGEVYVIQSWGCAVIYVVICAIQIVAPRGRR